MYLVHFPAGSALILFLSIFGNKIGVLKCLALFQGKELLLLWYLTCQKSPCTICKKQGKSVKGSFCNLAYCKLKKRLIGHSRRLLTGFRANSGVHYFVFGTPSWGFRQFSENSCTVL